MDYALFIIDFLDGNGRGIHTKTIAALDYMDAGDFGWELMPEGGEDFQLTELAPDELAPTALVYPSPTVEQAMIDAAAARGFDLAAHAVPDEQDAA